MESMNDRALGAYGMNQQLCFEMGSRVFNKQFCNEPTLMLSKGYVESVDAWASLSLMLSLGFHGFDRSLILTHALGACDF